MKFEQLIDHMKELGLTSDTDRQEVAKIVGLTDKEFEKYIMSQLTTFVEMGGKVPLPVAITTMVSHALSVGYTLRAMQEEN